MGKAGGTERDPNNDLPRSESTEYNMCIRCAAQKSDSSLESLQLENVLLFSEGFEGEVEMRMNVLYNLN